MSICFAQPSLIILSLPTCKHCRAAKKLLKDQNIQFQDYSVQEEELRDWCIKQSGKATVPQIWTFSGYYIGGNSELQKLHADGELEGIMAKEMEQEEEWREKMEEFEKLIEKVNSGKNEPEKKKEEQEEEDEAAKEVKEQIKTVVQAMRAEKGLIATRTYRLRQYKKCFIGRKLVKWLQQQSFDFIKSEADALAFGQTMLNLHILHHVTYSHSFKNDYLFYRLQEDEKTTVLNRKKIFTGKARPGGDVVKDLKRTLDDLGADFITEDGSVDYKGMKTSPKYQNYQDIASELQTLNLGEFTEDERKAIFINIYNSLVIHGFIEQGSPTNHFKRMKFFNNTKYEIGGEAYSLMDIEHGILRSNKRHISSISRRIKKNDRRGPFVCTKIDPRIHMALNCGAKSCPAISFYSLKNIDKELNISVQGFIENEVSIHPKKAKLKISKIFSWYKSDFGGGNKNLIKFIMEHSPENSPILKRLKEYKEKGVSVSIKFKKYDWSVNAKH